MVSTKQWGLYSAHPNITKMNEGLKIMYFWTRMKQNIIDNETRYREYHTVKEKPQHPTWVYLHDISTQKCQVTSIDFIMNGRKQYFEMAYYGSCGQIDISGINCSK